MRDSSLRLAAAPLVSLRRLEELLGRDRKDLFRIAERAGRYYEPFDRRVLRRPKWRHIDNPTGELKALQTKIQRRMLKGLALPKSMIGGVGGKSIRDNAAAHVDRPWLLTLDLKDCFPNISDRKVYRVFWEVLGCSQDIAALLTKLTTFQYRLPQGAPTSPMLANLSLLALERDLRELSRRFGLSLTFYVDDIAFSGARAPEVKSTVLHTIRKHGHDVRSSKVRCVPHRFGQVLTGTVPNRKISAGRRKIQSIRDRIFELSDRKVVVEHEIRTVIGQIRQVKFLCPSQGLSLGRLASRLLPGRVVKGRKPCNAEIRPCRCFARHRAGARADSVVAAA